VDLNLEPKPENPAQKRKIAMGLAFASAVMIVATLFMHSWLRAPDPIDAGFSLMSLQICDDGSCHTQSNKSLIDEYNRSARAAKAYGMDEEEKSPVFWVMGYATLAFGLLAAISLIVAGVTLGQGKLLMRPIAPTSTAMLFLFFALITACVFVATNPTRGNFSIQVGVGWAFWVFGTGTVLGIIAIPKILKFKPVEPDF
jgi:hypothetical protein